MVEPSGIASEEDFGASSANLQVDHSGISSAETFGTATVNLHVDASGLASAEAFGTAAVNLQTVSTGISSAEAFGTASLTSYVQPESITIAGELDPPDDFDVQLRDSEDFDVDLTSDEIVIGTPSVNLSLTIDTITSVEAFGTPSVVAHVQPASIASDEVFGTHVVNLAVAPTGIASDETFGTPALAAVTETFPSSIASDETFGTPAIGLSVAPTGIASDETLGTPSTFSSVHPSGIASDETFGAPSLIAPLVPESIASGEAFGTPSLGQVVYPESIVVGEGESTPENFDVQLRESEDFDVDLTGDPVATGTPSVGFLLAATGIASDEALGSPSTFSSVHPSGIASDEAFGAHTVGASIVATGIASDEAFGLAVVGVAQVFEFPGISSDEAFGIPTISFTVSPSAIASGQAFGTPVLLRGLQATGIASAEAFGLPILAGPVLLSSDEGIASEEALGTPSIGLRIEVPGIASSEAFGTPTLSTSLLAFGIPSEEAFGVPNISYEQTISPSAIASLESFGIPVIDAGIIVVSPVTGGTSDTDTFTGPTTGGTELTFVGMPLNMEMAEGDFDDATRWTRTSSGATFRSGETFIVGPDVASRVYRYNTTQERLDVTATLQTQQVKLTTAAAEASSWLGLYRDSTNYVRVGLLHTRSGTKLRLLQITNGATTVDYQLAATQKAATALRIVKSDETTHVMVGDQLLRSFDWNNGPVAIELGLATSAGARQTVKVSDYKRQPVFVFGETPATEVRRLTPFTYLVATPPADKPKLVNVEVTNDSYTIELGEIFQYTYPVDYQAIDSDGDLLATSDLLVHSD